MKPSRRVREAAAELLSAAASNGLWLDDAAGRLDVLGSPAWALAAAEVRRAACRFHFATNVLTYYAEAECRIRTGDHP